MEITFYKYQGTGNDFVVIDNRQKNFPKNNTKLIAQICDRRFGVGADGLMLLESHSTAHFAMVYFNSDGKPGSMCGNGGRCMVHFAKFLGIVENDAVFEAVDGLHKATIEGDIITLGMNNVAKLNVSDTFTFLNTGSPHHVQLVDELNDFDVVAVGQEIRNSLYKEQGANINFVQPLGNNNFSVRTYERGVEDETLSCGTGVTAVALTMFEIGKTQENKVTLHTLGGDLIVSFSKSDSGYDSICLTGPVSQVFKGVWK